MRNKLLKTMRVLLVAVLLGVGTSAWAQVSTWTAASGTYTKGQEIKGSTDGVIVMTLGEDDNWAYHAGRSGIYANTQQSPTTTNNIPTAGGYVVMTPTKTLKLTMSTYSSQSNCNLYMYESNGTKRQDFRQKAYCNNDFGTLEAGKTYYIYGGSFKATGDLEYIFFKGFTATTYENYTIHYVDNHGTTIKGDVVYSGLYGTEVTASEEDMAGIEYNDKYYVYDSGNESIELGTGTNEITLVYAQATAATITVKYWNDAEPAEEIKDATTIDSYVGATDVSASGDKLPTYIWYSDKKYKYDSGNTPIATVTGDATINLTYTEEDKYTCSVTDNLGNTLASGSVYAGESFYFGVPYYVFKAGKFYQSPSLSSGTLSYGAGTSPVINSNTEITVTYTEEASTNVVFYSEAESLTGITVKDDNYTQMRMSNKKAGYYASSTAFVTLPAGIYTLTSSTRSGTTRFYAGEVGSGREIMSLASTGSVVTTTSDPFILAEETKIYTSVGNSSTYFDYVIIRKTGDLPATENIVVTSADFATYVSNYNLNFTSATTKAYKVNVASKGVATLTEVSKVPAKTPVLLYCKGGNGEGEAIPVTTDAVSAVTGNNLVAGTGSTVATTDGDYTNMILNNVDSKIGFYFAAGQTVATNRAYLHIATTLAPDAVGGSRMVMVFGDETTSISEQFTVNDEQFATAPVFNLQGQRVEKPKKGLYIVNGKKMFLK